MVSVIIPARNEPYLQKTILGLLENSKEEIEIIVVLDGYWEDSDKIVDDKRVSYLHYSKSRGMRNAINKGVELAKGEYILKLDAHCMIAKGFDKELKENCNDNWVVVPRRYRLNPEKWEIIKDGRPPIDYMYLDSDLHGREWRSKNLDMKLRDTKIDELMSAQGSCWFMKKSYFKQLRILNDKVYGSFFSEFQEIGLKTWLYQGKVMVNKNTWYAHWHKTEGRGYSLGRREQRKALEHTAKWMNNLAWVEQQRQPLSWLIKRFWKVPSWSEDYIKHIERDGEVMFWRKWLQGTRGMKHMALRPLAPHVVEMIGDKKKVRIADLGSGPISTIGNTMEGVEVDYLPSDLLAEEYKEVFKYHNLTPMVYPEKQDMRKTTYKDESFDIVHCRNALDHCPDPYKALKEMYRICKKGGWIYLWHFDHVGKTMGYNGMHAWNIDIENKDCKFWNKKHSFLLSECVLGFVNEVVEKKHNIIISKLHK